MTADTPQVFVWICRHCGKRSYARRDPIAHHRAVVTPTDYGQRRDYLWCGPFDRYVATLDRSRAQRDAAAMPHLGTRARPPDEYDESGDEVFPF